MTILASFFCPRKRFLVNQLFFNTFVAYLLPNICIVLYLLSHHDTLAGGALCHVCCILLIDTTNNSLCVCVCVISGF